MAWTCSTTSSCILVVFLLGLASRCCYGFGSFGFDIHHQFSDPVKGILGDELLPEKDSIKYYVAMGHRDHVIRGHHLAANYGQSPLTFAPGNETEYGPNLGYLHYANVTVGTPSVWFLVALDTGSDLFWLPCDCSVKKGDEYWPLSGKPYFDIVLAKSHVKPLFQMVIPAKVHSMLPPLVIPTVLTYRGKNWKMSYNGTHRTHKKFDSGWRAFVNDNGLKAGDACVFELMEFCSKKLEFRVQILRGDIPSELLDKVSSEGESVSTPIVIE